MKQETMIGIRSFWAIVVLVVDGLRTGISGNAANNDLGAVQASQSVTEFRAVHGVDFALSLDERCIGEHVDDFSGQGTVGA